MSSAMATAIASGAIQPVIFVQIGFQTVTAYMWSGVGNLTWNGQTWTGLGSLLSLTTPEEGATVDAKGITVVLSGLDAALLSNCLTEFQLGLPAIIYFGAFSSGAVIADPLVAWSGRTDQPVFDVGPEKVTIGINCENRLLDMNIATDRRLTHQDQQMQWPGDLGLMFVDGLQEKTLFWGQQPNTTNNI
jgi:hypothetical protein